jgi:hypothetical protein
MESIEAIRETMKKVGHELHNEIKHPPSQGFMGPVIAGLAAYGIAVVALLAVGATIMF